MLHLRLVLLISFLFLFHTSFGNEITDYERIINSGQGFNHCESCDEECSIESSKEIRTLVLPPIYTSCLCKCGLSIPPNKLNVGQNNSIINLRFKKRQVNFKLIVTSIPPSVTRTELIPAENDRPEMKCNFPDSAQIISCELHSETENKTLKSCYYQAFTGNDTITCTAMIRGSMTPIQSRTNFFKAPKEEASVTNKLRVETNLGTIDLCLAENLVTKTLINVEENLLTEEYSAGETSFSKGICELLFLKGSLQKDHPWRMHAKVKELAGTDYEFVGRIFNAPKSVDDWTVQSLLQEFDETKSIDFRRNGSFQCPIAPYPLTHCYLRLQNKTVIRPPKELFERSSKLGVCVFPEVKLEKDTPEELVCSFNSVDKKSSNVQQRYAVEDQQIISMHAEYTRISCRMHLNVMITSCLFVNPNGALLHVPSSNYTSRYYSYYGTGLENGYCGIEVHYDGDMTGEWRCLIDTDSFQGEETMFIR